MGKAFGFALGLLMLVRAVPAAAQGGPVCVTLDETRDTLAPEDRRAAVLSLMQALAKNGQQVVQQGCFATYTVYHVKLGATISVYLYGPNGYREARASKLDELPLVYEQCVRALLTNQTVGGPGTVDRTNATNDQMAPRRVAADDVKYVRLGYGTVTGGDLVGGPAFGFGWRFELDKFAIDVSAINLILATDSRTRNAAGITGSLIELAFYYFSSPLADYTSYFGGGVSWGLTGVTDNMTGHAYAGSGLQGNAIAGFEMFRSSTIRTFVQADAILPFYDSSDKITGGSSSRYTPCFSISIGAGWGKSNTIAVVQR